jgi:hypothetical protein
MGGGLGALYRCWTQPLTVPCCSCGPRTRRRLGLQLPSTLVFDYPTTAAVTSYLAERLAPAAEEQAQRAAPAADGQALNRLPSAPSLAAPAMGAVAVVATLARPFASPATASAPGLGGVPLADVIAPVPLSRWDRRLQAGSPASAGLGAQFGAFLADADLFDASAFSLSAGEALAMDPQHRLLLESAGELLAGPGQRLAAHGELGNGETAASACSACALAPGMRGGAAQRDCRP